MLPSIVRDVVNIVYGLGSGATISLCEKISTVNIVSL